MRKFWKKNSKINAIFCKYTLNIQINKHKQLKHSKTLIIKKA